MSTVTLSLDADLQRPVARTSVEDERWPRHWTLAFVCGASASLWSAIGYVVSLAI